MSTRDHVDDGEWAAQERALSEERADTPLSSDARVREYRLIAQALRNPPLDRIPDDFAVRTAAVAEAYSAGDDRLERRLQAGLLVLLALSGVLSMTRFDGQWLGVLASAAEEPIATGLQTVASWAGALVACIVFSWLMERWLGRLMRRW